MAGTFLLSSLKRSLESSLVLNSKADFIKTIETLKTRRIKYEEIASQLTQAYSKWKFTDPEIVSYLLSKSNQGGIKDLENLSKILRYFSIIDYASVIQVIKPIESLMDSLHPFEMTITQMIFLLKSMEQARFHSKSILDFITFAILSSNLPCGRLNQELMAQLLKWFSNTQELDERLWSLLQEKLETCRFFHFSYENFISIMHSLTMIDNYLIPKNLINDFESFNFSKVDDNIKKEAITVKNYLKSFKNISVANKTLTLYEKKEISPSSLREMTKLHSSVEDVLKSMNISFKSEQCLLPTDFSTLVDLLLPENKVIEIQGPFHYLHPMRKELGRTIKKREFLKGVRVLGC
jgi:hypothetical protein